MKAVQIVPEYVKKRLSGNHEWLFRWLRLQMKKTKKIDGIDASYVMPLSDTAVVSEKKLKERTKEALIEKMHVNHPKLTDEAWVWRKFGAVSCLCRLKTLLR